MPGQLKFGSSLTLITLLTITGLLERLQLKNSQRKEMYGTRNEERGEQVLCHLLVRHLSAP